MALDKGPFVSVLAFQLLAAVGDHMLCSAVHISLTDLFIVAYQTHVESSDCLQY